jgi:sulfatase maturation enzyme AslB (radical SAM superfamily)
MNAQTSAPVSQTVSIDAVLAILIADLRKGSDQPEIWQAFPRLLESYPGLSDAARASCEVGEAYPLSIEQGVRIALSVIAAFCDAHETQDLDAAYARLSRLALTENDDVMVQGALFHLESLMRPGDPRYDLTDKFCAIPFEQLHVLENSATLCCASWLPISSGNLYKEKWEDVWNSPASQAVRESIHDGSYRYCNKTTCPRIQKNDMQSGAEVAKRSHTWMKIVEEKLTSLPHGPQDVNLAYDRTCNLSCPSCRTEKYAADGGTRRHYDALQQEKILPMLREAKSVFITGSGDPFASKNFRRLMEQLGADGYPDLRFRIMTNAMLLTEREWERFPALHGRVQSLQISIDGVSPETHEPLRRGSRWSVMQDNLRFAARLKREGLVEQLHLSFTVQTLNYHELGEACDLANELEVNSIYFGRLTNWGTFGVDQYAEHAVFLPAHPQHADFLAHMADPRLRGARINIGNLTEFLPQLVEA